jgi:hydrogenase 3 maturation protease
MSPADGDFSELTECLSQLRGSKTVIVGIGNMLKGDDAAGPMLCQKIAGRVCAKVIDAGATPENYIEHIKKCKCDNVLVVDTVDFGATPGPPGRIRFFTRDRIGSYAFSTHVLSPRFFADLIAKDVSGNVFFLGIQPAHTNLGRAVSPPVVAAVDLLARLLSEAFPLADPNSEP